MGMSIPDTSSAQWTTTVSTFELRDYFAGQAMVGLLSSCAHPEAVGSNHASYPESSAHAYEIADAMLAEREKQSTESA